MREITLRWEPKEGERRDPAPEAVAAVKRAAYLIDASEGEVLLDGERVWQFPPPAPSRDS